MQIKGTLKQIGETGEYGQSNFKKRQILVLEDAEKYPQTIPIDFVQDKCSILDQYNQGEAVVVDINIRANEYNGKHYVSLQGWKIAKTEPFGPKSEVDKYEESKKATPKTPDQAFEPEEGLNEEEEHDPLPF